jgi:hypothetical protein
MNELDAISKFFEGCGWGIDVIWKESIIGGVYWTVAFAPTVPFRKKYIVSVLNNAIVMGRDNTTPDYDDVAEPDFVGELADPDVFDKMRAAMKTLAKY